MTATEFDEIVDLVAHAAQYHDNWIPQPGPVPSALSHRQHRHLSEPLDLGYAWVQHTTREQLESLLVDPTARVLRDGTPAYPDRLRDLDGRPALLFVQGRLDSSHHAPLAIVGSRAASPQGIRDAGAIGAAIGAKGHSIISGLAAGIDAAGHEGALSANGHTVAVMGTGLGKVFPDENSGLAERIATAGALVSQFPPGYGPTKTTFPARNTLIAGLSAVSLVIEMKEHSGTRIELESALAQSKPVLLWEPILGKRQWARDLAEHPLVRFVSTSEEVVEALVSSEHGPRRADRTDRRAG